jgi:SAM-dependent methyltransferase
LLGIEKAEDAIPGQSSASRRGVVVVVHVSQETPPEVAHQIASGSSCFASQVDSELIGEVWVVIHDITQPSCSLLVKNRSPLNTSSGVAHELVVGPDWGWGAIQKLFFRRVLQEGFSGLITVAEGTPTEAAIESLMQSSHRNEVSDVVSLLRHSTQSTNDGSAIVLARRYSDAFLKRIPFDFNEDGDAFDDDVMRQRSHLGVAHEHRSIPALSQCAGFPQAGALRRRIEELRFRLHSLGIWCSLKYRDLSPARYRDKSEKAYSSHSLAIDEIRKAGVKTILDLGCGPGHVARKCRDAGIVVHGVDMAQPLPDTVSEFTPCDLDHGPYPFDIWQYEAVLLLDVIEHLSAPEEFLAAIRHQCGANQCGAKRLSSSSKTDQRPLIVLTTPNVAFAAIRIGLLLGRFNYADRGILDMTHRRLFTRGALITALRNSGYDVEAVRPVPAPFSAVLPGVMGAMLNRFAALAAWLMPSWFAFQWLIRCRPKPGLGHLTQSEV